MIPEEVEVSRCSQCLNFYWLKEAGWVDPDSPIFLIDDIPGVDPITVDEYFELLNEYPRLGRSDERYVRQEIWWGMNDPIRETLETDYVMNDRYYKNIKRLYRLLRPSIVEEQIMKAEICRNLGSFKECVEILSGIKDNEIEKVKNRFLLECQLRNSKLFAFETDS